MRLGGGAAPPARNAAGNPNMPSRGHMVAGVMGSLALIFVVGAFMSFSSVEVTEYGLNYSLVRRLASPEAFGPGRYWIGPFNYFVKFPATLQTVQFSDSKLQTDIEGAGADLLRSRTRDGLDVRIELSFQYQLDKNKLYDLYTTFGEYEYHDVFIRIATDRLTEIATSFTATEFFSDRNIIGKTMEEFLKSQFQQKLYSSVYSFQLRAVSLPIEYEDAIQETEVAKQDMKLATMEQNSTRVGEETKVIQATRRTQVKMNEADGNAKAVMLANTADISLYTALQEKSADSYADVLADLDDNPNDLLGYMETRVVREHPSDHTVLGLDVPSLGRK